MSVAKKDYKKITVQSLTEMKANGEKISMLTAYDFTMARIVDQSKVDVILVGDSASNVMAGHETTLPITLDQMIYHASSVVRAVSRALVEVDIPFGSYQSDPKEALRSAIRIMKESGGHAVKLALWLWTIWGRNFVANAKETSALPKMCWQWCKTGRDPCRKSSRVWARQGYRPVWP